MFPYQVVCEGKADEVFFGRLLKASGKNVDVNCPKKDDPNGGMGKAAIHKRLIGLQSQFDKITVLIVVVDSDDDPANAFAEARDEFNKANAANPSKTYPVPVTPNTLAAGPLSTAIVLVPEIGAQGCLDSLLLPSFEQAFPGRPVTCANDFCACVRGPVRGGYSRDARLRLRALIAATQRNPGASLANLLEEGHCPIDIAHPSFDLIRAVLNGLFP